MSLAWSKFLSTHDQKNVKAKTKEKIKPFLRKYESNLGKPQNI